MENIEQTLLDLNISSPEFLEFMMGKIKVLDTAQIEWYGAFPIVDENGILKDIRLLVPTPNNKRNILINIHEFTHAFELFQELGYPYESKTIERETKARAKEEEYQNTLVLKKENY